MIDTVEWRFNFCVHANNFPVSGSHGGNSLKHISKKNQAGKIDILKPAGNSGSWTRKPCNAGRLREAEGYRHTGCGIINNGSRERSAVTGLNAG